MKGKKEREKIDDILDYLAETIKREAENMEGSTSARGYMASEAVFDFAALMYEKVKCIASE